MNQCHKRQGKLDFVRVEESSDVRTIHSGLLIYAEQLVCRYDCRSAIYRCVEGRTAWPLLHCHECCGLPRYLDSRSPPTFPTIELRYRFLDTPKGLKTDFGGIESVSQKRYLSNWNYSGS